MLAVLLFASLALDCMCTLTQDYYRDAYEEYASKSGEPLFEGLEVLKKNQLKLNFKVKSPTKKRLQFTPCYDDEDPYFHSEKEGNFRLESVQFQFMDDGEESRILITLRSTDGNKEKKWTVISLLYKQPNYSAGLLADSMKKCVYATTINNDLINNIEATDGENVKHNIDWIVKVLKREPPFFTYFYVNNPLDVMAVGLPVIVKDKDVISYLEKRAGC